MFELTLTAWEARHPAGSAGSEFVLARAAVALPVMALIIFFLIGYVRFRLDPYEHRLTRAGPA